MIDEYELMLIRLGKPVTFNINANDHLYRQYRLINGEVQGYLRCSQQWIPQQYFQIKFTINDILHMMIGKSINVEDLSITFTIDNISYTR